MVRKRQLRFILTAAVIFASGSGVAQQGGFPPAGTSQLPQPAPNDPSNPRNYKYQPTIVPSLMDMGRGIDQGNIDPFVTLDDRQFAWILSARLEIRLPDTLDAKRTANLDRMEALSGPAFDRAYLNQVIRLQNRALTITEREADKGGVVGLRNWAGRMVPVLESQLETAKRNLAADAAVSRK